MNTSVDHYDRLLAEHVTWMLGGDIHAAAAEQEQLLRGLGVAARGGASTAIDLGCGSGAQTLALAGLGFAPVVAVDANRALLDELDDHANELGADRGDIRIVQTDIRTALPRVTPPGSAEVVVCMGDTLTHLPAKADVSALLLDAARTLAPGGRLVLTYRDLSRPLHGTDRFIPVRATDDKVLTCFLEYLDADTVVVHDLLHVRSGSDWSFRASGYPKLRIGADWVRDECIAAGLSVDRDFTGPRGMQVLHAVKS
jgi:SAM-dependent methyltransferase